MNQKSRTIFFHSIFISIIVFLFHQGAYYEKKKVLFMNDLELYTRLYELEREDLDEKILKRKLLVFRLQSIRNDLLNLRK